MFKDECARIIVSCATDKNVGASSLVSCHIRDKGLASASSIELFVACMLCYQLESTDYHRGMHNSYDKVSSSIELENRDGKPLRKELISK